MNRLIAANSVPFANADVAPGSGTPQYATVGNPATSTPATQFPAYAWNMVQDELMALLTAASITPDDTNWAQVLAALKTLFRGQNAQSFTSTGTWTAPAGVTKAECMVWSGGGGGGGSGGSGGAGGSGGGGAFAEGTYTVTPGTAYTVTVGAGGAGGFSGGSGTVGANGGASSFGSFATCTGGGGGGFSNTSLWGSGATGGTAAGGTERNINGQTSGTPVVIGGGILSGIGGAAYGGQGLFNYGASTPNPGISSFGYGSGGTGGLNGANGGAGVGGLVIIRW